VALLALAEREEPRALHRFEQELTRDDSVLSPQERELISGTITKLGRG
jgi:hypothetical protein